jgi:1,4-dihydroxy-2-naphthoyl-CoA synthase
MKRMVYEGLEANSFPLSLAYEGWAQEMCYLTEDVQEGINSFMEKRPPHFTGK